MIVGTGIDLVEIDRISRAWDRFGDRFVHRILCPDEWDYCRNLREPGPSLAARFAAKEAVSKALGTGIGSRLNWHCIEIARRDTGEPTVVLHSMGQEVLAARGGRMVHLSLSHTRTHAIAMAIVED